MSETEMSESEAQKSVATAESTATGGPARQPWGRTSRYPPTTWVKVRELVGQSFRLESIGEAVIKGQPVLVFRMSGNSAFSVKKGDSHIARQIEQKGMPPIPGDYTITRYTPPGTTRTIYSLEEVIP